MADAELAASVEAANACGLSLSSFVFPLNRIGHRDLLAEHGFDCYRATAEPNWYDNSRVLIALGKFASFSVGRNEPLTVTPSLTSIDWSPSPTSSTSPSRDSRGSSST